MFVRIKTTPRSPKKAVQIVKSIRTGNKISQKIIRHVGFALDEAELKQLKQLAESIRIKLESDTQQMLISPEEMALTIISQKKRVVQSRQENKVDCLVNIHDVVEEERVVVGIHDVYGKMFDELGYRYIFPNPARREHLVRTFRDIVLARIANPVSKRATVDMLEERFGISIPLQNVYRMMDKLDDQVVAKLNKITWQNTQNLYGKEIDVVFFDATTIYFESFSEDELKCCGYSKDLKFNQPQVMLVLLVTKEGLPISYRVFEGNMYEGHTLLPVLMELRREYTIGRVVFVADSGMFNKANLEGLQENGFEYIVGARLRNMGRELKKKILDKSNYTNIGEGTELAEFAYKDCSRLIVSYKENRAKKDRNDREKALERITDRLAKTKTQKAYLGNYGYKKYLKVKGESEIELDEDKINLDSQWDGLHGVITNARNLSCLDIMEQYCNLWYVEEAFRITKHDLKVRPVYHWTPSRVKAHMAISFTAFALVKFMEYRVKLQYKKMSPELIRQHLINVQSSICSDTVKKIRFVIPSRMSQETRKLYSIFKLDRSETPWIINCSA